MSRYHSHLHTACRLIESYRGGEPFAIYARHFFRSNSKYGSSDRKSILSLCYGFFRGGFVFRHMPLEEQLMAGTFLTASGSSALIDVLKPEWSAYSAAPWEQKLRLLQSDMSEDTFLNTLFPYAHLLSTSISFAAYASSLLRQPLVFIRLRPGQGTFVRDQLTKAGIAFQSVGEHALSFPSATNLDAILIKDRHYVVQDLNSQRMQELFPPWAHAASPEVWDCCAASGGKSILAWDHYDRPNITVSDIRESILHNLDRRLLQAGVRVKRKWCMDLTRQADVNSRSAILSQKPFDLIIADVPCSGSGTWARTPEQLVFFDPRELEAYAAKQELILKRVVTAMAPGHYLLYITCSVFSSENERQVERIQQQHGLRLVRTACFEGYTKDADTLFGALFTA